MSLTLPRVLVAAESLEALIRIGSPWILDSNFRSLVLVTNDPSDECIVMVSPDLSTYRAVWKTATGLGFVEAPSELGAGVDIDHVFPASWANLSGSNLKYVRLFPVWREVNRGAGGGLEKNALRSGLARAVKPERGLVYGNRLQVLKMLNHPVGTVSDPELGPFGTKRKHQI